MPGEGSLVSKREFIGNLRRRLRGLPTGLIPEYTVRPPNRPITIYRGRFAVEQGGTPIALNGSLAFRWFPSCDVQFCGTVTQRDQYVDLDTPVKLHVPSRRIRAEGFVTRVEHGNRDRVTGTLNHRVRCGQDREISSLRFHLANFHDYIGTNIRFGSLLGVILLSWTVVGASPAAAVDALLGRRPTTRPEPPAVTHPHISS